jgi:hypothetical protein
MFFGLLGKAREVNGAIILTQNSIGNPNPLGIDVHKLAVGQEAGAGELAGIKDVMSKLE